jgi:hypothetical protein
VRGVSVPTLRSGRGMKPVLSAFPASMVPMVETLYLFYRHLRILLVLVVVVLGWG